MNRLLVTAVLLAMFGSAVAEEKVAPKFALNFCPLAIPIADLYAVIFESNFAPHQGIVLRLGYAPTSEDNIDITDKAVTINYRWYLNRTFDSFFTGIYSRYRTNTGSGTAAGTRFDYESTEIDIGLNIGKRWIWKNGFNFVATAGYGFSDFKETVTNQNAAVKTALDSYKDGKYDIFFDEPFYGELSIGYTF